jgi:hypothetical protein
VGRPLEILITLLTLGVFCGCTRERAALDVSLTVPVASRFIVHGNCFAGWYIALDVIVRETKGVDVLIESVSLRVDDTSAGLLGERMVDAPFLRDRFGESGASLPAHGSIRIPMSVGALGGSIVAPAISGSVVVSGDILAADEQGTLRTSYRLPAGVRIDDSPLPSAGACSQPAAGG